MAESRVKRATTSYMKVNVRTDRLGVTDLKVDWISLLNLDLIWEIVLTACLSKLSKSEIRSLLKRGLVIVR